MVNANQQYTMTMPTGEGMSSMLTEGPFIKTNRMHGVPTCNTTFRVLQHIAFMGSEQPCIPRVNAHGFSCRANEIRWPGSLAWGAGQEAKSRQSRESYHQHGRGSHHVQLATHPPGHRTSTLMTITIAVISFIQELII